MDQRWKTRSGRVQIPEGMLAEIPQADSGGEIVLGELRGRLVRMIWPPCAIRRRARRLRRAAR